MSSIIRWEPFRELSTLHDRMTRLFNEAAGRVGTPEGVDLTAGLWNPAVDVYETNDSIVMKADLPDVKQNEVDVSIEGNTLTIKGERKREKEVNEKSYYRSERTYRSFLRSFTLPGTVDPEKIEATFTNGVLKLTLPKREETKPKQIKVKVNSDGK